MSNEVVVLWRKEEAYIQLVMHLYKYATEAVCGVLLGTINYTEDKYSSTITVDECLPLSHINLKSNPMLQVGIQLAQIIAKKQHIALIGCYIAGERFDASEPTDGLWLVNQVSQQCDTCKLLLVSDNRKLVPDVRTSQVPLRFFQISSSRENAKEIEKDKLESIPISLLEKTEEFLLDKEKMESFHDFDDHCMEPRYDWMNRHIKSLSLDID